LGEFDAINKVTQNKVLHLYVSSSILHCVDEGSRGYIIRKYHRVDMCNLKFYRFQLLLHKDTEVLRRGSRLDQMDWQLEHTRLESMCSGMFLKPTTFHL